MYEHYFRKLPSSWKQDLKSCEFSVVGFVGYQLYPLGEISLSFILTNHIGKKTCMIKYTTLCIMSLYNFILERSIMLKFRSITSSIHCLLNCWLLNRVATIIDTSPKMLQLVRCLCQTQSPETIKCPYRIPLSEVINNEYLDQIVKMGKPGKVTKG